MSTLPDNEFDLEKLFLPAWAQGDPSANKYAKYEGETVRSDAREGRRGPRPPRRDGPPRDRRDGDRNRGDRRGPRDPRRGGPRPASGDRVEFRKGGHREHVEPPPPLPEINVSLVPDETGAESLARQIKRTGRAYPLFDIARMILQKPERHAAQLSVKKNAEGRPIQPLFLCALDDTLWLSEDEAVAHVLKRHFATFYQTERTPTEPPKGRYTFVAQCGMSGVVLGPPNYHDYQNQLRKLHAERFSRLPFDVYKSRVRIVRDEEVVKKWIDDQSWKTEYVCLNLPEPLRLPSMEAVEKHFRETHKENIIKQVESHTLSGAAGRSLRSPELSRLLRSVTEDQRRFPLQIATVLSQQFATHGLQFFKVNKTVTHVSVARPHYLDLATTPVSEGVKRIVDFINAHPRSNRRKLVEALAPTPPSTPAPTVETPPAPADAAAEAGQPPQTPTGAEKPVGPAAGNSEPTPEQTAVIADLHWLIHEGHVIEFASGVLETAKKPLPKPPKPEKTAAPPPPGPASVVPAEAGVPETAVETVPQQESSSVEETSPAASEAETHAEPAADSPPAAAEPAPVEPSPAPVESPS